MSAAAAARSSHFGGSAGGEPLDQAMVEARGRLAQEGPNTVDFATPVLFLADPLCLRVDPEPSRAPARQVALDLTCIRLHMLEVTEEPVKEPHDHG